MGNQSAKNTNNQGGSTGDAPIVLQDAATVEKEKAQTQSVNQNFDQYGNALTYSKKQILSWKGEIVNEPLNIDQVSEGELIEMLK